jgi:hypothetical protein
MEGNGLHGWWDNRALREPVAEGVGLGSLGPDPSKQKEMVAKADGG